LPPHLRGRAEQVASPCVASSRKPHRLVEPMPWHVLWTAFSEPGNEPVPGVALLLGMAADVLGDSCCRCGGCKHRSCIPSARNAATRILDANWDEVLTLADVIERLAELDAAEHEHVETRIVAPEHQLAVT